MADTKDGGGKHGPSMSHIRVLMATPLYRILTSRVLAPWALQGIRPEGEVLEVGRAWVPWRPIF